MDKNKKRALAAAGVAGVAGVAGIAAANVSNEKVELGNTNNPAIVTEATSDNDAKVTEAISDLGVVTTASDSSKSAETTTSTTIELGDYGISLSDYRNMKAGTTSVQTTVPNTNVYEESVAPQSNNTTETQTIDSFTDTDNDYYELLRETIVRLSSFDVNYESMGLADMIISNYGVELSPKQAARYDRLMNQTYMAYSEAIASYNNGDVSGFRRRYTEIINGQFLNLDDLIDILSININTANKVINNSKNYSISKDELVIDDVHVKSLFSNPSYAYRDIMSILGQFDGAPVSELNSLKILQVPLMVMREVTSPTSFCLFTDGIVYEYRNEELDTAFNDINNYYAESTGLNNFGYEDNGNGSMIYGNDEKGEKQYILPKDCDDYMNLSMYVRNFYPNYQRSKGGRVGYFDGSEIYSFVNGMQEKMQEKSATK